MAYPIRLAQLERCWADGSWSAFWFPDLNEGRGYPFLGFYAPLVFFSAGLFQTAGASLPLALKLPVVLGMVAGTAGTYRLARLAGGAAGAMTAAALATYAPYHVRDLYIRGDLAEHLATSLLPWSLFAFLRLGRSRAARDVVLAAALGALPILTHNILGLVTGGMLVIAAAFACAFSEQPLRAGVAAACAGLGTLSLSAFFWVPALYERRWVQIEAMTGGVYDIERNFLSPGSLFGPAAVPGIDQQLPMSFELGWPALLLVLFVPFALRGAARARRAVLATAGTALVLGLLLSTRAGAPVYDAVPLLRFVQFPWRFLALASLGLALLGGIGFGALLEQRPARLRVALAAAAVLFAVAAVRPLLGPKPNDDIPPWAIDPEELARGRQTTTGVGEYLPIWAGEAPHRREFDRGIRKAAGLSIEGEGRGVGRYDFTVEAADSTALLLRDLYYPGWTATVNGRPVVVRPAAESGNVEIVVGPGRHRVLARLEPSPVRRGARLVSVGAAVLALAAVLVPRRRR